MYNKINILVLVLLFIILGLRIKDKFINQNNKIKCYKKDDDYTFHLRGSYLICIRN